MSDFQCQGKYKFLRYVGLTVAYLVNQGLHPTASHSRSSARLRWSGCLVAQRRPSLDKDEQRHENMDI